MTTIINMLVKWLAKYYWQPDWNTLDQAFYKELEKHAYVGPTDEELRAQLHAAEYDYDI